MNENQVINLVYLELIKIVGGASVLLAGFSAVLGKIWVNRIANKESQIREVKIAELKASFEKEHSELKAKLDIGLQRTVFVDKLQFEHEYTIYRLAWEALCNLRQATLQLRPTHDNIDPNEPEEERMKKRISAFIEPFNAYLGVVEKNKPFYSQSVYEAMWDVLQKCRVEQINYEYSERSSREYYEEARKHHEEIIDSVNNTCNAIRNRISEVRVH